MMLLWRLLVRASHCVLHSFPATQHLQFKLADMATDLHVGRTLIRQAAAMLDAKDPSARSFCAMAKRVATDNGFKVRVGAAG
jgi:alkylation response protein AidB-like acyl-CoA dehydrogenase